MACISSLTSATPRATAATRPGHSADSSLGGSAQSGFAAFPLVDPVVVADASGDGRANVVDATLLLLEAIGLTG